jgi:signal transduction histidine kinase
LLPHAVPTFVIPIIIVIAVVFAIILAVFFAVFLAVLIAVVLAVVFTIILAVFFAVFFAVLIAVVIAVVFTVLIAVVIAVVFTAMLAMVFAMVLTVVFAAMLAMVLAARLAVFPTILVTIARTITVAICVAVGVHVDIQIRAPIVRHAPVLLVITALGFVRNPHGPVRAGKGQSLGPGGLGSLTRIRHFGVNRYRDVLIDARVPGYIEPEFIQRKFVNVFTIDGTAVVLERKMTNLGITRLVLRQLISRDGHGHFGTQQGPAVGGHDANVEIGVVVGDVYLAGGHVLAGN